MHMKCSRCLRFHNYPPKLPQSFLWVQILLMKTPTREASVHEATFMPSSCFEPLISPVTHISLFASRCAQNRG